MIEFRLSVDEVERRWFDGDGNTSCVPGLLCECGDGGRGVGGVTSILVAELTGDDVGDAGCAYCSDPLGIRGPDISLVAVEK